MSNYREYKAGDTVCVTGFNGYLYNGRGFRRELADGVKLGVTCELRSDQDHDLEVGLPDGILADGNSYIHISCISLVQAVEDKRKEAIIEHKAMYNMYEVNNHDDTRHVAKVWYDDRDLPKDVAEKLAKDIKAAYDAHMNK